MADDIESDADDAPESDQPVAGPGGPPAESLAMILNRDVLPRLKKPARSPKTKRTKRNAIPKSTRFEVFKRDKFTCQYCGGKAPDVLLEIDHIHPVSKGGDNEILNLVTSCEACNSGKSDKLLSDDSAIEKQRDQLERLQERREQLDLLMQWKQDVISVRDDAVARLAEFYKQRAVGWVLNERGVSDLRKWLRSYPPDEIMDAIDVAVDQYGKRSDDGKITKESIGDVMHYVPRILRVKQLEREKPHIRELFYIRGILRKRCSGRDYGVCMALLEEAFDAGIPVSTLRRMATEQNSSWWSWQKEIEALIADTKGSSAEKT